VAIHRIVKFFMDGTQNRNVRRIRCHGSKQFDNFICMILINVCGSNFRDDNKFTSTNAYWLSDVHTKHFETDIASFWCWSCCDLLEYFLQSYLKSED
jgi:hypothetical protein